MARSRLDSRRRALHTGEYEKTDGHYEFRWRDKVGVNKKTGRAVYKQRSITATTLDELRELEKTLQRDEADGLVSNKTITLNTYVDKWLRIKRGLKENTKQNYIYMYDRFLRSSRIGKMPLQQLKKSDLIGFYGEMIDSGELSVSTCATLQSVVGPALELAVDEDVIRRNISRGALNELKKEDKQKQAEARARGEHRIESLTVAEQKRLLQVINGSPFEPAIRITLYLGLRVGELTALTFSDIDEVNKVVHINKTLVYYSKPDGKCGMSLHSTKTKAGTRDLPLTKEVLDMIKLQKKLNEKVPKCCAVDGVDDFVFVTRVGTPHRQDTLNRALRRIVDTANDEAGEDDVLLPRFSMHKLRKTACTNAIAAGATLEQVAKWLGHSDYGITGQIYSQARIDIQLDTSRKAIAGMPNEISEISAKSSAEDEGR